MIYLNQILKIPFSGEPIHYNAKNRDEFKKHYIKIFTDEVINYFGKTKPYKYYNNDMYGIDNPYILRDFLFEKIDNEWKLTAFPYFP